METSQNNQVFRQLLHNMLLSVSTFSQAELDDACKHFQLQTLTPKASIFNQGDRVEDIHFILSGIGRYYYLDQEGKERNKSLVRKSGAFTSISSLIENAPSPFYTQALTECVIATINYETLIKLSHSNKCWGEFIRKIYERLALKKEKREAGFLLLSAQQRYQQFLDEFGEESTQIPLNQVAMYLGVTDVSLSRIRKQMGLTTTA